MIESELVCANDDSPLNLVFRLDATPEVTLTVDAPVVNCVPLAAIDALTLMVASPTSICVPVGDIEDDTEIVLAPRSICVPAALSDALADKSASPPNDDHSLCS